MQLIKEATEEKLRGGFYTPEPIAAFILKWAFNGNTELDILEPSCGDGVFLKEIQKKKGTGARRNPNGIFHGTHERQPRECPRPTKRVVATRSNPDGDTAGESNVNLQKRETPAK
jgi:hypothetical protein